MEEYKKNPNLYRPGTVRLSYGLYNDFKEINVLVELLRQIGNKVDYYDYKYRNPPFYSK